MHMKGVGGERENQIDQMREQGEWVEVRRKYNRVRSSYVPVPCYQPRNQANHNYGANIVEEVVENFKKLERSTYTVFVDNVSMRIKLQLLWEIFSREGHVMDVFLSKKQRTCSKWRFAFVRYTYNNHAQRTVQNLHGWEVDSVPLIVKEAKYRRNDDKRSKVDSERMQFRKEKSKRYNRSKTTQDKREKGNQMTNEEKSYKSVLLKNEAKNSMGIIWTSEPVLLGEVEGNVNNMERLRRSLIGKIIIPLNKQKIIPNLFKECHTLKEVRRMGLFKMMLEFDSKLNMKEVLTSSFLLNYFEKVTP
ncbi:hypothetical protein HN51_024899 [Arachis hypogaea]